MNMPSYSLRLATVTVTAWLSLITTTGKPIRRRHDHRVHVQHLLGDIVHALEQLARCFTEYQETMVSERRQRYDQMMNKAQALKNLIELLPGLDETLALNRPAMNELAAFVGWKIILVEDDEWFKLEGGRLRLGSAELKELFKGSVPAGDPGQLYTD